VITAQREGELVTGKPLKPNVGAIHQLREVHRRNVLNKPGTLEDARERTQVVAANGALCTPSGEFTVPLTTLGDIGMLPRKFTDTLVTRLEA
jgi:hypothetical protein